MRVLGIDPGYAIVGYGLLNALPGQVTPVTYGALTTESHTLFEDRLCEVYDDMCELLATCRPDAVAIETLFFNSNQKNGGGGGRGPRGDSIGGAQGEPAGI